MVQDALRRNCHQFYDGIAVEFHTLDLVTCLVHIRHCRANCMLQARGFSMKHAPNLPIATGR